MEIVLHSLLEKQAELDHRINVEHNVTHLTTKKERFLALLVEVGELANATRSFKYWSLKPSESRERLLDEFADGLHFFLSLALVYNFAVDKVTYPSASNTKKDINELFATLYQDILHFMEQESESTYFKALTTFLTLGSALLFTASDILGGYMAKLVVNYTRQNTKY